MLQPNEFRELFETRGRGCVSIYMPTHRRGRDVREDPIRLGNLLAKAQERARASGLDGATAARTLAPVRALLDDTEFWRHQAEGLGLFASEAGLREHRLARAVDELVVVGERFCVRPLLPCRASGRHFFVLAISQKHVRLFECSQDSVQELDLEDTPRTLAEAVGQDWEEKSLQFHTGAPSSGTGRREAMFHGHGGNEVAKEELEKFIQEVDAGVTALLKNRHGPLVLATVGYAASIYRQVSSHPQLMDEAIEGNHDGVDPEELQQKALPIVAPHLSRELDEQLARLGSARHTPLAAVELQTVLAAARDARVDVLFVASDATLWGTFDAASGVVEVHDEWAPGREDLLDLAVASSLGSGARVFGLHQREIPDGALVAAILRYTV